MGCGQRLEVRDQTIGGDSVAQVALKRRPLLDMSVQVSVEEVETAAAVSLCPVQGDVGSAHQRVGAAIFRPRYRDADADADLHDGSVGKPERLF